MPIQNLIAGFDPTGQVNIAGEDLKALVELAQPYADKGLMLFTDDVAGVPVVPDAVGTVELKQYMWIRRLAGSVIAYLWNDAGALDATYLKWQSITQVAIAPGSVTNVALAPGSVTDDKIVSVAYGKITGVPLALPPNGPAGGDLTGTYPNPTIGVNAVDHTKIAAGQVLNANIGDGVIEPSTKLIVPPPQALAIIRTDKDSALWEYSPLPTLQILAKKIHTDSTTLVIPWDNTIPQVGEGKEVAGANMSITPLSSASMIRIRFRCFVHSDPGIARAKATIALFSDASANAIQASTWFGEAAGTAGTKDLQLEAYVASPGKGVATAYSIRFGPDVNTTTNYINDDGASLFGAAANSFFIIEELRGTLS